MDLCRRRHRLLLALAFAAASLVSSGAFAGPEPTEAELDQARERFVEARRLEDAGRWREALEELKRVAQVKMTPQVRFHIALCTEQLGKWTQALDMFTQAASEAEGTAAQVVIEAKQHIRKLESELPTLSIHVRDAAPGDELFLDRQALPISAHPLPIRADPGPHNAELRRDGAVVAREYFSLEPKATRRIELHVGSVAPLPKGEESPRGTNKSKDGRTQRVLGWTALGVSAASAISTGVFVGLREGALTRLDEACPAMTQCPRSVATIVDEGKTYATLVNVFSVLTGVAAVGGVAMLLTVPSSRAGAAPPSAPQAGFVLRPVIGARIMGVSVEGTF